jgi:hypothetical protein
VVQVWAHLDIFPMLLLSEEPKCIHNNDDINNIDDTQSFAYQSHEQIKLPNQAVHRRLHEPWKCISNGTL